MSHARSLKLQRSLVSRADHATYRDTALDALKSVGWLFLFAGFSVVVYFVRAFASLAYPKTGRAWGRRPIKRSDTLADWDATQSR